MRTMKKTFKINANIFTHTRIFKNKRKQWRNNVTVLYLPASFNNACPKSGLLRKRLI
jgi:hypothetical protein